MGRGGVAACAATDEESEVRPQMLNVCGLCRERAGLCSRWSGFCCCGLLLVGLCCSCGDSPPAIGCSTGLCCCLATGEGLASSASPSACCPRYAVPSTTFCADACGCKARVSVPACAVVLDDAPKSSCLLCCSARSKSCNHGCTPIDNPLHILLMPVGVFSRTDWRCLHGLTRVTRPYLLLQRQR